MMSSMLGQDKLQYDGIDETLRVVEFFSGIGGWSSALKVQDGLKFDVVAAYDVKSVSNEVYKHVYGITPCSSAIESLSLKTLEAHNADIWVRKLLGQATSLNQCCHNHR